MANHKSSIKRIRQTNARRLHNRYYAKTARNAVRRFRALTDAAEARAALPQLSSMLDRLAGKKIIHKNKAANLKSKLANGPFVYRLGRKIFILERGVRFPQGLPSKKHRHPPCEVCRCFAFIGSLYEEDWSRGPFVIACSI